MSTLDLQYRQDYLETPKRDLLRILEDARAVLKAEATMLDGLEFYDGMGRKPLLTESLIVGRLLEYFPRDPTVEQCQTLMKLSCIFSPEYRPVLLAPLNEITENPEHRLYWPILHAFAAVDMGYAQKLRDLAMQSELQIMEHTRQNPVVKGCCQGH